MSRRPRSTSLTSREFNQDTAGAKKAAARGPVIITDRGQPAHVLLTYEHYQELAGRLPDIVSLLGMVEAADIELDAPRATGLTKPVDLS